MRVAETVTLPAMLPHCPATLLQQRTIDLLVELPGEADREIPLQAMFPSLAALTSPIRVLLKSQRKLQNKFMKEQLSFVSLQCGGLSRTPITTALVTGYINVAKAPRTGKVAMKIVKLLGETMLMFGLSLTTMMRALKRSRIT